MSHTPVHGCRGCASSAGALGCPDHGPHTWPGNAAEPSVVTTAIPPRFTVQLCPLCNGSGADGGLPIECSACRGHRLLRVDQYDGTVTPAFGPLDPDVEPDDSENRVTFMVTHDAEGVVRLWCPEHWPGQCERHPGSGWKTHQTNYLRGERSCSERSCSYPPRPTTDNQEG